jgi:benzoyl-CoA reductase/2-hydroxyglutaryl-CoA dehydratase subunit BcrC/BadD/HgdB
MIGLLKLCGFEAHEIESELPRVEKVFSRLEITTEDIEIAKQRLTKYYDVELLGVRKALRLCVRELLKLVLAREEGKTKIIYAFMASSFVPIQSALASKSKQVHAAQPTELFQLILGCIFDKMVPVMEAAEGKWLRAGAIAHCANVKTIAEIIASDRVPKPDLLVTCGYLCETAPKTVELLHELYDVPSACFDTCYDREEMEHPVVTKRIIDLAAKNLRKTAERAQEVVGFEFTDDLLWDVLHARYRLADAIRKLHVLIEESDPIPISIGHETIWRCLGGIPFSIDDIPDAIDAMDTLGEELQERVNKGFGVVAKGAPRVLTFCPPDYTDPRPSHLATEVGIALLAKAFDLPVPDAGRPPDSGTKIKDPYEEIAFKRQCQFVSQNSQMRIASIIEGCKRLNVDGMLDRYHVGCRNIGDSMIIKEALTKELGIPVLMLEWEDFDPRVYNHEQYKRRLELFKTMLTSKR